MKRFSELSRPRRLLPLIVAAASCIGTVALPSARQDSLGALPEALTRPAFWQLVDALSEDSADFISDNLVSNEASFAQVVPEITEARLPPGVYVGVGPEQNYTFIESLRPQMAFIVDIRRANLLLHLMYKAIFEMSEDRASFIARLFSRSPAIAIDKSSGAAALMQAFEMARPLSSADFANNVVALRDHLTSSGGKHLTSTDLSELEAMYRHFYTFGPTINYASTLRTPNVRVTFSLLMSQTDRHGAELSFLASESGFRAVKGMHARNLIVPVVGNFAGPKAIRAIGDYVRRHGATIRAFYLSNVEDYLGRQPQIPPNGRWIDFCRNVATLPLNDNSVFIRPLGLAMFRRDGSFLMSPSISIMLTGVDVTTLRIADMPALPRALTPIHADLQACKTAVH